MADRRWYYSQWRFAAEGNSWIDLLILDELRLSVDIKDLELWRFHRRNVNDEAQHQFTFFYYTTDRLAGIIQRDLKYGLRIMERYSLEEGILFQQAKMTKTGLGETSDPTWPPVVREYWPYFITGTCQVFLRMMEKHLDLMGPREEDEPVRSYYSRLDAKMVEDWQDMGHAVFIHHIAALFGGKWCSLKRAKEVAVVF